MKQYRFIFLSICAVLFFTNPALSGSKPLTTAPLIPLEDFYKNSEKTYFQISPDGKHIAFMQPWKSRMNVFVRELDSDRATRLTEAKERDIADYIWCSNERIVYMQDNKGDENYMLYAVNLDGSARKELTPFEKVKAKIIDDLEDNDQEMIIGLNKRDPKVFDAYRINVYNGEMKMIAQNSGKITSWVTDNDGKLRAALETDGVNKSILYRENEDQKFEKVATVNYRDTLIPVMFTFDNKSLYMESNLGRDKIALVVFDPREKREIQKIYEHPDVDIQDIIYSKKRKLLSGVEFITWKTERYFLDDETRSIYKDIAKKIPKYNFSLTNHNKAEDLFIVDAYSDRLRGSFYLYDAKNKKLSHLALVMPWLREDDLAQMKPVSYKSRDGLTINGYLTLPKGSPGKNIPVVVNPHGGPWNRDEWYYNTTVQFFANRGYAVFQMNFRGSTGYGRKFWEASFKEWGKRMQDDITDGVQWLINQPSA